MPRTDPELLDAARAGEAAAVDELLARHEHQVYRFGLRMCGDEEAARDVLQETPTPTRSATRSRRRSLRCPRAPARW